MGNNKKKDFSNVNINPVYNHIAEATADVQEAQEQQENKKERKTYNEQEAHEFLNSMKTAGRKGLELPRINMAFSQENYEYIKAISHFNGITYTQFVNSLIAKSLEENREIYENILETRKHFGL